MKIYVLIENIRSEYNPSVIHEIYHAVFLSRQDGEDYINFHHKDQPGFEILEEDIYL